MEPHLFFIFGTRPELIKLAPVIHEADRQKLRVTLCNTGQHKELLAPLLDVFNISPQYSLECFEDNQSLNQLSASILHKIGPILQKETPDIVLVQGDTTSAFIGGLAAYYEKIPVAHIEAGLRSYDHSNPFPEEGNRRLLSQIASYHFCPTEMDKKNLEKEALTAPCMVVGNTSIDTLLETLPTVKSNPSYIQKLKALKIDPAKKIILMTCHRRETLDTELDNVIDAIITLAQKNPEIQCVWPLHPNPKILSQLNQKIRPENVCIIPPLDYPLLIQLLDLCHIVITDSGGLQEEAPSLQKPILVIRKKTERHIGITAKTAKLIGTNTETIVKEAEALLQSKEHYNALIATKNPYGNGTSSKAIIQYLASVFSTSGTSTKTTMASQYPHP